MELTDVIEDGEAAACVAVLDTAIEELPPRRDPFPEWRAESLRDARERFAEHAEGEHSEIDSDDVEALLDVCSALSPTPHERVEHGEEKHPDHVFGEVGIALRPFLGSEIPKPPEDE